MKIKYYKYKKIHKNNYKNNKFNQLNNKTLRNKNLMKQAQVQKRKKQFQDKNFMN